MAPNVEANSLSDITQLAGNPPKYPRNPTETKRNPLTLYVARVPGSKDIILTTLKPQLKNVTAEDVASSLYYLHLNTEDDVRFLNEDAVAALEEADTDEEPNIKKHLPRKPLPESTRSSIDITRQLSSASTTPDPSAVPKRKPVTAESSRPTPSPVPVQENLPVSRRPFGPRPLFSDPTVERTPLEEVENRALTSTSRAQDQASSPKHSSATSTGNIPNELDDEDVGANLHSPNAFSITLIRRDPSSGAQWNIGSISGNPTPDEARSRRAQGAPRSRRPCFDMLVHLTTPGYGYFRNTQSTGHVEEGVTAAHKNTGGQTTAGQSQTFPHSSLGFDRQIRMGGSSFWDRPSTQHKRALSDISDRHSARGRSSGGSSAAGLSEIPPLSKDSLHDHNDSQEKGYTFLSPWGGRCKFSTGSGGRSLRCKHSLPAPVAASSTTREFTSSPLPPAIVSELRFNLPSTSVFTSSTPASDSKKGGVESGRFSIPKFSHIRNKLSSHKVPPPLPPRPHATSYAALYPSDQDEPPPLPPRSYSIPVARDSSEEEAPPPIPRRNHPFPYSARLPSEDEEEDEEARLDLSIGREKAGGGNRGKRAKLGKLIIHDEGFKFLDLVVAANMAIWWSVWESDHR